MHVTKNGWPEKQTTWFDFRAGMKDETRAGTWKDFQGVESLSTQEERLLAQPT